MTRTEEPSLTERYIHQTLRHLPAQQRADVEHELRGALADDVEARLVQSESRDDAEFAVLEAWGDPEALAATYTERPLVLIGPKYYLDYLRLLKLLVGIVAPILAITVSAVTWAEEPALGPALWAGLWASIQVGVALTFWITIGFALLDRYSKKPKDPAESWTPEDLPEAPTARVTTSETSYIVSTTALFVALLMFQHFQGFVTDDAGDGVPLLNPELWTLWLPIYIALLVAGAVAALFRHSQGLWTMRDAVINAVLNAASAGVLIAVVTWTAPINPDFAAQLAWDPTGEYRWIGALVIAVVVAIEGYDAWDGWRKARAGDPKRTPVSA